MSILPKLIGLYKESGWEPLTGYSSYHFEGYMDAPFTALMKGDRLVGHLGLALQEVMFLEHFNLYIKPRRILVLGNAYGWSTVALALIFPGANVVGIDPATEGNALTNEIAVRHGLAAIAISARSPEDVGAVCADHLGGTCDLALVDAIHTNDAIISDVRACVPYSHENTIFVFHDLINWGLVDGFQRVLSEHMLSGKVLTRTPSGMGVAFKKAPQDFQDYIAAFSDDANLFRAYRRWVIERRGDKAHAVLNRLTASGTW
jgi:hypothetical protein